MFKNLKQHFIIYDVLRTINNHKSNKIANTQKFKNSWACIIYERRVYTFLKQVYSLRFT